MTPSYLQLPCQGGFKSSDDGRLLIRRQRLPHCSDYCPEVLYHARSVCCPVLATSQPQPRCHKYNLFRNQTLSDGSPDAPSEPLGYGTCPPRQRLIPVRSNVPHWASVSQMVLLRSCRSFFGPGLSAHWLRFCMGCLDAWRGLPRQPLPNSLEQLTGRPLGLPLHVGQKSTSDADEDRATHGLPSDRTRTVNESVAQLISSIIRHLKSD